MTSCSKVYDPQIDTTQKVLEIDGMITDKTNAYHIILAYPVPFNSSDKGTPVSGANVYVTDDLGNSYKFNERTAGDYVSDSLEFTGQAGHTYHLHIATADGTEYESDPQKMFPEVSPDNIYAEFDTKETLDSYSGLKVNTHGADIFIDINNHFDSLPRFRFTSNLVMQYFYSKHLLLTWDILLRFDFYCWQTVNVNPVFNLTDEIYSLNSASIKKHQVCFLDDNFNVYGQSYDYKINWADTTGIPIENGFQFFMIYHRILYLNQYTLNNETYLYYKSLNEQMQSEGKLFDPVAIQLTGNIKCITDPERKAIGFFEASSVSSSEYVVDFIDIVSSQPTLIKEPYIVPPETNGIRIDRLGLKSIQHNIPSFWIF
jgi:Domain of unknown function (DUF4249)